MIGSTFMIMWLRLWRDKGAFALAFLLPGVIFAVFAAIFSTASGGTLDLRVGMTAASDPVSAVEFAQTLQDEAQFDLDFDPEGTAAQLSEAVRLGQYDVGIHIARSPLESTEIRDSRNAPDAPSPPFVILGDPNRTVATTVLKGQLRQYMADQAGVRAPDLFETRSVMAASGEAPNDQSVTYYIGGTAILFLLFSAMQAANITIEERRSGITDRLMLGRGGVMLRMVGKLLFMTLIGCAQAAIIVAVAAIFFSVPLAPHIGLIALACLAAALIAAAIALLVASLCGSQTQMHAVSTFLVLIFSAVGGSMVPRFMMPGWLQDIGQFTPNYWVIEAFYGILARGQSVTSLWLVWSVLFGSAALCILLAAYLSHRLRRG